MSCHSLDLTIDAVLADPVIGAAMQADRVDPRRFEVMLRTTAARLDDARSTAPLLAVLAERVRAVASGSCLPW